MTRRIDENAEGRFLYLEDGRVLFLLKNVDRHRYSRRTWPDFESAKKAYDDARIEWGDWIDAAPPTKG